MFLEGEDARRFHEYMENPHAHMTESGRRLFREALRLYHDNRCPVCGQRGFELRRRFDPPV